MTDLNLENARKRLAQKLERTPNESRALRAAHPYNRTGQLISAAWCAVAVVLIGVLVYLVLQGMSA